MIISNGWSNIGNVSKWFQFAFINVDLFDKPKSIEFWIDIFKASSDWSIPIPLESLISSKTLNNKHPVPVPKSNILLTLLLLLFKFNSKILSIKTSESGLGINVEWLQLNLCFQKYL